MVAHPNLRTKFIHSMQHNVDRILEVWQSEERIPKLLVVDAFAHRKSPKSELNQSKFRFELDLLCARQQNGTHTSEWHRSYDANKSPPIIWHGAPYWTGSKSAYGSRSIDTKLTSFIFIFLFEILLEAQAPPHIPFGNVSFECVWMNERANNCYYRHWFYAPVSLWPNTHNESSSYVVASGGAILCNWMEVNAPLP